MDVIDRTERAWDALAAARASEIERIADALGEHHIVGLLGEAEVGKTVTVRQALRLQRPALRAIELDLNRAASDEHVGFLLAKEIARTVLGPTDFSLLAVGVLLPGRVERGRLQLAELLGVEGLDEACRDWPSGRYSSATALRALETLVRTGSDLVLWIDHVEAPLLTPRHPLKVDELLWGIRELSQRESRLRVVLSGRAAVQADLVGPRAAFHQQGRWLSLDVPPPAAWVEVARQLGTSTRAAQRFAGLTGGHPTTMLLLLLEERQPDQPAARPEEVLSELAARDDGLANRALQHARSLHRLGGQVLEQVALGERPYATAQRGTASPQEIRKVLNRLRVAGLLRRTDAWGIVNPLVAIGLRHTLHELPSLVDEDDEDR
jgi:hypothetical protein